MCKLIAESKTVLEQIACKILCESLHQVFLVLFYIIAHCTNNTLLMGFLKAMSTVFS